MGEENTMITVRVRNDLRDEWREHRDELEMKSYSEYIRAMVAAGRKQYSSIPKFRSADGPSVRQRIERELSDETYTSWEDLIDGLVVDLEENVEKELEQMEEVGAVEHSPRNGGWRLNG